MLNENIARFISDNSLLSKEGKHIVALSGGADSVALLLLLNHLVLLQLIQSFLWSIIKKW